MCMLFPDFYVLIHIIYYLINTCDITSEGLLLTHHSGSVVELYMDIVWMPVCMFLTVNTAKH